MFIRNIQYIDIIITFNVNYLEMFPRDLFEEISVGAELVQKKTKTLQDKI